MNKHSEQETIAAALTRKSDQISGESFIEILNRVHEL